MFWELSMEGGHIDRDSGDVDWMFVVDEVSGILSDAHLLSLLIYRFG